MEAFLPKTDVWDAVLAFVEQRLNKHIFETWFRAITFDSLDERSRTITLRAGQVTKDWVTLYYSALIEQGLASLELSDYHLEWKIDKTETPEARFAAPTEADADAEIALAATARGNGADAGASPAKNRSLTRRLRQTGKSYGSPASPPSSLA